MSQARKPWDGIIPPEDLEAFGRGFQEARPMTAGRRPALIVVDLTRAFVDSTYPSGYSPTGWPCVEANAVLLKAARAAGIPTYFTKGYHEVGYRATPAERGRWKTSGAPPADLPEGTLPGDVIVEALTPRPNELVVAKGQHPSAFNGTQLASFMIYEGCDTAIVSGMSTSGCVRATVLDAFQLNFHCVIPYECCADRGQLSHQVNLFDMHMKYADVVSLDETVDYLEKLDQA